MARIRARPAEMWLSALLQTVSCDAFRPPTGRSGCTNSGPDMTLAIVGRPRATDRQRNDRHAWRKQVVTAPTSFAGSDQTIGTLS